MVIRILHTNDFHGRLDELRVDQLQKLRAECDLYFDNGDAIKTGNLGIPLREEAVWSSLAQLRCTASVLGNRETHVIDSAFKAKLKGATHPILCANMRRRDGSTALPGHLVLECKGLKIGIVGVMVAMVTDKMKTQAASAYLWDDPISTAVAEGQKLRSKVDLLIALTHIGLQPDERLALRTNDYDLILGGHSHTVLEQPRIVSGTPILQTGSHGRFAGIYEWEGKLTSAQLVPLG